MAANRPAILIWLYSICFIWTKIREELFVGISKRSTAKGADYLAKVFQIPVHHIAVEGFVQKSETKSRNFRLESIKVMRIYREFWSITKDNLHLKSNVTLLKPGTIVYSDDKAGQGVMKQMKEKSTKSYDFVAVPDEKGSIFDLNESLFMSHYLWPLSIQYIFYDIII